jgi:hypothetical protein
VLKSGVMRDPGTIVNEVVQMVRDTIGPVASFTLTFTCRWERCAQRLPIPSPETGYTDEQSPSSASLPPTSRWPRPRSVRSEEGAPDHLTGNTEAAPAHMEGHVSR